MKRIHGKRYIALAVCTAVVMGAALIARPAEATNIPPGVSGSGVELVEVISDGPSPESLEARETVMSERLALGEAGVSNLTELAGPCQLDGQVEARAPMPIAEALAAGEFDLPVSLTAPCCRICTVGRACGNSCISARLNCRVGVGCACNAGGTGGGFVPAPVPVPTLSPSVSFSRQSAYPQMRVGATTAVSADLSVLFATWSSGDLEMRVSNAAEVGAGLRGWDENGLLARSTVSSSAHSFRGLIQALVPGVWRLRVAFYHRTLGRVGPDGVYWDVNVAPLPGVARLYEGWHSRWAGQSDYPTLRPGQSADLWIRYTNVGTETWTRGLWGTQVNLALNADDRTPYELGMADGWLWDNRIATTTAPTVRPGEIGEFRFRLRAPLVPGTYSLNLRPVVDGTAWLEDEGVFWTIVVR